MSGDHPADPGHTWRVLGTPDSGLLHFRSPDHVTIISGDTQIVVQIPVDAIERVDAEELSILRTVGTPAWFSPEPVRDELLVVQHRVVEADREAVDVALSEAEYACRYGTGVAVVPPSGT